MIKPLEPPDSHYLNAAQGWLELGLPLEANAELEKISLRHIARPDVLELRWQIFAQAKKWSDCLTVAAAIIQLAPDEPMGLIHRSFALHELKRTAEARDNLMPAVDKFPKDVTMRYNLACYECQLGNLERAKLWLERAATMSNPKEIKSMALDDPDLKPLWQEIGGF